MTQAEQPVQPTKPILRCDKCSATYRRLRWTQGMKCPKCKSPDFFPVTIIGGAVDYTLADRSHGYALEDIRFAQLAKWSGLITPNQYTLTLSRQRQLASQSSSAPHIAQVMVSEGILESTESASVFQIMCKERPAEDDEVFAGIAVQNRLAKSARVEECKAVQQQMAKSKHEVPPLGQIMFEKRFLSENQVQAIYRKMVARRQGLVFEMAQAYEHNRELSAFEKMAGTKDEPDRRKSFYVFCGLAVLILLVWSKWLFFSSSSERMWFHCDACAKTYEASFEDTFPVECKLCKKEEARFARKCGDCSEVFGTNGWWGRVSCPHCKKWRRIDHYKGK